MWRIWAKALGQKGSKCNHESDNIAIIRTVIFLSYLITNLFIIAGVIRHWNDDSTRDCNRAYNTLTIKPVISFPTKPAGIA
jgi:hypothetical protein